MDMSDRSDAIRDLNARAAVARLPTNIRYGEIINDRVRLGRLTVGPMGFSYTTFDEPFQANYGEQLSDAARNYILDSNIVPGPQFNTNPVNTTATFHGDGLIEAANQRFTLLNGFPANAAIAPRPVTDRDLVHTDAPNQFGDILIQLRILAPGWFPSPPP